jgi:hypothetical protein
MTNTGFSGVLIDKNGEIKNIKIYNPLDKTECFKKCGFRNEKGFEMCGTWELSNNIIVELYGKKDGKSGSENKYEFPPPNDNILLFGTCLLLTKNEETDEYGHLTSESWEKIYDKLFGGFESLGEEDSELSEDEEEVAPENLTKHGYKKDGFIVDDSESEPEDDYTGSELTDEEYYYSDD